MPVFFLFVNVCACVYLCMCVFIRVCECVYVSVYCISELVGVDENKARNSFW